MSEPQKTHAPASGVSEAAGNPVFEFEAAFRARAGLLQAWLVRAGGGLLLAGMLMGWGVSAPWVTPMLTWGLAAGGTLLLGAGLAWGFAWRGWLRAAFRERYGLK